MMIPSLAQPANAMGPSSFTLRQPPRATDLSLPRSNQRNARRHFSTTSLEVMTQKPSCPETAFLPGVRIVR